MIRKKIFFVFFLFFSSLSFGNCISLSSPGFFSLGYIRCKWGDCEGFGLSDSYCSETMHGCLGSCPSTKQLSGYYYTSQVKSSYCSNLGVCNVNNVPDLCYYKIRCDTQAEADSVYNSLQCDSTKYTCETKTEQNTEQTSSDQITCVNGTCYGVTACKYWSTFTTTCVNECGTNATQESYSTDPIFIEGACDDADFNGECSAVKCTQIDDRYIIYQTCATNNIENGELQMIPKIQSAGKGTCASQGYPNEPFGGNSSSSANADSVSNECLLFGACSSYSSDTTDYSNPFNRDSEHGCTCDDDGGSARISRITCPDGSVSIEVGTCSDWNNKHSSSSTATPSSSSAAEGGGTDSTGGDWATSGQAEDIKDSLGAINGTLKAIGDFLSAMNPAWSSGEVGELTPAMIESIFGAGEYDGIESVGVDSLPTWADSMSIDTLVYKDRLDSMFGALPTTNTLLDTLNFDHSSKCPVLKVPISTHWFEHEVTINCASLGGFDLCTIGATLVIMMASVFVLMFQIKMIIRAFAG